MPKWHISWRPALGAYRFKWLDRPISTQAVELSMQTPSLPRCPVSLDHESLDHSSGTFDSHRNCASHHASNLRGLGEGITWVFHLEFQAVLTMYLLSLYPTAGYCLPVFILPTRMEAAVGLELCVFIFVSPMPRTWLVLSNCLFQE